MSLHQPSIGIWTHFATWHLGFPFAGPFVLSLVLSPPSVSLCEVNQWHLSNLSEEANLLHKSPFTSLAIDIMETFSFKVHSTGTKITSPFRYTFYEEQNLDNELAF